MRVMWMLLTLVSLATGSALAQDPVVADPAHYSVVFENDQVRVLRIQYGPNEEGAMHEHPAGVVVYLDDLNGEFTLPDGTVVSSQGKKGDVVWTEAGAHQPKNLTDAPFEVIQVELKPQANAGE